MNLTPPHINRWWFLHVSLPPHMLERMSRLPVLLLALLLVAPLAAVTITSNADYDCVCTGCAKPFCANCKVHADAFLANRPTIFKMQLNEISSAGKKNDDEHRMDFVLRNLSMLTQLALHSSHRSPSTSFASSMASFPAPRRQPNAPAFRNNIVRTAVAARAPVYIATRRRANSGHRLLHLPARMLSPLIPRRQGFRPLLPPRQLSPKQSLSIMWRTLWDCPFIMSHTCATM